MNLLVEIIVLAVDRSAGSAFFGSPHFEFRARALPDLLVSVRLEYWHGVAWFRGGRSADLGENQHDQHD